jgi:hypothetical protein
MGSILNTRTTNDGKIIFEVLLDYEESLRLQGHVKNVHLFSSDVVDSSSKICTRGRGGSTKYFLIPKDLRDELQFKSKVRCQLMETESKKLYIFMIDKLGF